QKPQVQQISGKAVFDLIAKGEVPASPTIFRDHVDQGIALKAPVKWAPLEPVVANIGQANLSIKPPHPHAAMLFIDYLLGPDGQKVLKDNFYTLPTEKPNFQYWVPEDGRTAAQVEDDGNKWAGRLWGCCWAVGSPGLRSEPMRPSSSSCTQPASSASPCRASYEVSAGSSCWARALGR